MKAVGSLQGEALAFFDSLKHRYYNDPDSVALTLVVRHRGDEGNSVIVSAEKLDDLAKVSDLVSNVRQRILESIAKHPPSTGTPQ